MSLDPVTLSKRAVYWPELVWDSTVQTLGAGATLQQPLVNWPSFGQYKMLVNLVSVTTMQQAGVLLNITADNYIAPALITSLRPNLSPGLGRWLASRVLTVNLQNTGAVQYLTQADYSLWVWPLSDGLRYAFDMPATGSTRAAAGAALPENLRELIDDGLRPLTGDELLRREDMNWFTQEITVAANVLSTQSYPVYTGHVRPGRTLVLTGFSCDPSLGGTQTLAQQQAAALTLNISRDQQPTYLSPLLAGISATRFIPLWIPALTSLTVDLTAAVAQNPVPIMLTIADMPLSTLNRTRWSEVTGATPANTNPRLWNMVRNGGY